METPNREAILNVLSANLEEIRSRFQVRRLAVFGSAARDQLRPDSDVDILIDYEGGTTYHGYFGLLEYLENIFGRKVDLITEQGLKPRVRKDVERELLRVA